MPVRSLASSVLKWPDKRTVDQAVKTWAERLASANPHIRGIAYFGLRPGGLGCGERP